MSTFKAMKFQVESVKHSDQIQRHLFDLGYGWHHEPVKVPLYQFSKYLFTDADGFITHEESNPETFEMAEGDVTTLEELKAMVEKKHADNNDLIKRIETLEKQMAMIHTFHTPLKAPPFRPEPKYATGILVEGLDKPIEHEKHVEFTHQVYSASGWSTEVLPIDRFKTIHYMGECEADGDMFYAESHKGYIHVLKGHLNSGTY